MLRSFPLLLLLPAVAFAQTPEVVQKVDAKLDAERTAQRNEDVEILRRLLNKAVGLPDKATVWTSKQESAELGVVLGTGKVVSGSRERVETASPVGPFDGVYLPGAGVVFTLHVPAGAPRAVHGERIGLSSSCSVCHQPQVQQPHAASASLANCSSCHDATTHHPEKAVSDWDRTKMDVRGEKPKTADPTKGDKRRAEVCEPGNLQTLVAGVLAANAKHVRHLGEKEGVTVVVTFDEVKPTGRVWKGTSYYEPVEKVEDGKPVTKYELRTKEEWVDEPAPSQLPADGKAFTPSEVKTLALGDLHMKQGKHKEACDAYGEALSRFWAKPFKVTAPASLTAAQKQQYADELQKGVRDAMKSYAKALLLADQPERAKEALEMATGFVAVEVTPTTVPASSTAPAKLIVSVTKAEVDAAKDAAAVKKAVKGERLNFPK